MTVDDYVLDSVADDYESWQLILQSVRQFAKSDHVSIRRSQVLAALESLVAKGLVQPYILRSTLTDWATPVAWDLDRLHELWYYITPAGREKLRAKS